MDGRDGRTITCSRIGCDAPATASFSFDALNGLAWLDTVVEARGAGFLCRDHAERLTPPRGWSLLDRRSPEPKLFVQLRADAARAKTPGGATERPARKSRAKQRPRRARGFRPVDVRAAVRRSAAATMPRSWSVRDLPALDDEFDDRTPMLARAFESLRQSQSEPGAAAGSTVGDATAPPAAT